MDEIIAACMGYEGPSSFLDDIATSSDQPIWILGKKYTITEVDSLRRDILSRLWLTYRKNFPPIGSTTFTSDNGWGCMLRCGQMVIAEALVRIHLGRDWRWNKDTREDPTYSRIVSLFHDDPRNLYSVHNIALVGADEGKPVGEWYGPNTVAHVLKRVCGFDDWNKFSIHVAMDNCFIMDEMKQSSLQDSSVHWKPLLIFVPLRLGVSEVNSIYISGIKNCLRMPQCLGVLGGTPNHALYFIGYVGDDIIYLDPHTTQESGTPEEEDPGNVSIDHASYHCDQPLKMAFQLLDPSLALAFLCLTEKEFDDLCNRLKQDSVVSSSSTPLFELLPTRPCYMKDSDSPAGATAVGFNDFAYDSEDDEEFEVLEC